MLPLYEGFDKGVKMGYYVSVIGIIIALILIIISISLFVKQSTKWGIALMAIGLTTGGIAGYWFNRLNKSTVSILAEQNPLARRVLGEGEINFDGDTVINVDDNCNCNYDNIVDEYDGSKSLKKGRDEPAELADDSQNILRVIEILKKDDIELNELYDKLVDTTDIDVLIDLIITKLDQLKSAYDNLDDSDKDLVKQRLDSLKLNKIEIIKSGIIE